MTLHHHVEMIVEVEEEVDLEEEEEVLEEGISIDGSNGTKPHHNRSSRIQTNKPQDSRTLKTFHKPNTQQ